MRKVAMFSPAALAGADGVSEHMRHLIAMLFFASVLFAADAQAQTLTRMSPFNLNWKFYKGSPSGTPSQTAYADNSWPMVSVPHSVSYNEPTPSGEAAGYEGIAWYRKSFTVPASAKKVFLYFEGAMQTADVWINGISCGRHDNSGYTGFVFDISDKVARGTVNVCAVKLDNTRSLDIPPGVANPDYYLGSGIYRDVWLMFTDSVYIPYCGQRLGTRNVSTGTATVNAKTAVTNSSTVSKSCEITVTLVDSSGASVRSVTTTKIIAAGSTDTLIADISGISSPKLWSPEHPYLYSVRTMVKSGNNVVDSIAQPLGFRWFTWSATNGFSLNGSRYQLRGACVHQGLGWINSAVPNSRFYKQVEFIKEMGANSIRSSHYPRDPAFYDACDKLGMTLLVEIPTWGYSTASYSGACWTRFNSSVTEMITQGYNHPSIIAWGLFNEAGGDYSSQVRQLNATAHALDTTRPTYLANNPVQPHSGTADIFGMNYMLANSNQSYKLLNTEYHASWIDWCKRGNANDVDNSYANNKWRDWSDVVNAGPRLAGGYMWCFADYFSWWHTDKYMGIVDHLWVPKNAYYLYRKNWAGRDPDYPQNGTAAKIDLIADLTTLRADGADISRLIATIRTAAGVCVNTITPVTLTLNGPATIFGSSTLTTAAGRTGALLRTTTGPGTITVIASAAGLTPDTVRLLSQPVTEDFVAVRKSQAPAAASPLRLDIVASQQWITLAFPRGGAETRLKVINAQGKVVASMVTEKPTMRINRTAMARGLLLFVWNDDRRKITVRRNYINF